MTSNHMIRTAGVMAAILLGSVTPEALAATKIFTSNETISATNLTWEGYDIIIRGATVTIDGHHAFNSLIIEHNGANPGVLTHSPGVISGGISGVSLDIATFVSIEGAGAGYPASAISLNARGYPAGVGPGAGLPANEASGAGHGGAGGFGSGAWGGVSYGSFMEPALHGSGGGNDANSGVLGGAGGGTLKMVVGGEVLVNGVISANGANLGGSQAGAGSGGSVWIIADSLSGTGTITAHGGNGSSSFSGGGGGGRVSAKTNALNMPSNKLQAYGGLGLENAGPGTVWIDAPAFERPTLIVDNGGTQGTGIAEVRDTFVVPGDLLVRNQGRIGPPRLHANLSINVEGSATIESSGQITAAGRGFEADSGPGAGQPANEASGAGHGGAGGFGSAAVGGVTYGEFTLANTMGSGGGSDSNSGVPGGSGGGTFALTVADQLLVNGTITANGSNNNGSQSGAGAGGGIRISCGLLAGNGVISANGGAASTSFAGGGGGGRIVATADAITFPDTKIQAFGGAGLEFAGPGTIWLDVPTYPNPTLIIDNGGTPSGGIAEVRDTFIVPGDLIVRNQGRLGPPRLHPDLRIKVLNNAQIQPTGRITADGRGFASATGPGAGVSANEAGGGGHGGKGGNGANGAGGVAYGASPLPTTSGSGGGFDINSGVPGGAGGGVLWIDVAGQLTVNGTLSANGFSSPGSQSGGGAGGTVVARAGSLSGTGLISTDGGSASTSFAGGGGGGHTIIYTCNSTLAPSQIRAAGGVGLQSGFVGKVALYSGSITISDQPDDTFAPQGSVASLKVQATGSGVVSYQWRFNGVPLQASAKYIGVNQPQLFITNVNCSTDQGLYDVVITDSCGIAPSLPAKLTIAPAGDLNNDCTVGPPDLALLLGQWGACGANCAADLNGNGQVDSPDLAILLGNWG